MIFLEPGRNSGYKGFMKKPCATCGGTGQIGFFQGESRFLLTWEECPRCLGTGLREAPEEGRTIASDPQTGKGKKSRKKDGMK
ncbi:MAG: hypothetical protein C4563_04020 [Desulfobulbus sp.]|nr:MAG: hypothetical protein C4563_04020 [Desulfobulbus sp.]